MTPTVPRRIAVGSIFIECNQFGGVPADLARFEQCELQRNRDVLTMTNGVVGGMLSALSASRSHIQPLLVASACPSGPVTPECYETLKQELLHSMTASLPLDGILLALHGAGAVLDTFHDSGANRQTTLPAPLLADNRSANSAAGASGPTTGNALARSCFPVPAFDLEADLLESVRATVGDRVPIVATLDMHAHISEPMIHSADALIAWETYPHRDSFETGERGAKLLNHLISGRYRPTMALAKAPVLVGGCRGQTEGKGAFPELAQMTREFKQLPGVIATALTMTHPYLDFAKMGGGALVVTDNNIDQAIRLSRQVADLYWERRAELEPELYTPEAAIREGLTVPGGPVLLVETADCAGGGAAGDSIATARALVQANLDSPSCAMVVDPEAATNCHRTGIGRKVTLTIGHRLDPRWGQPATWTGNIVGLSDGSFEYSGGIWKGTTAHMGPAAVFQVGQVQILIASHATYDWADEQYRSLGMDPHQAKFVVVKNPMNYHLGYANIARKSLILDTPGPTPASVQPLHYQKMAPPYFPLNESFPDWQPHVLRSRS